MNTAGLVRVHEQSRYIILGIGVVTAVYLLCLLGGILPSAHSGSPEPEVFESSQSISRNVYVPPLWAVFPFLSLLLAVAVLPLVQRAAAWWRLNRNRFLVVVVLSLVTLFYYWWRHPAGLSNHFIHREGASVGWETVEAVLSNAILVEYIPFIVLLFSLYVISGGIHLRGSLPAHPLTNCVFLSIGALLASFVGTTGAAMMLIRPLISSNAERKHRSHTIIFFIFIVCNCGGLLLPIGDPPLFLGYLRGVPFTWTLGLWPYWLGVNLSLLAIYYIWDTVAYGHEAVRDILRDEVYVSPLQLSGAGNLFLILGVIFSVAFIIPGQAFLGSGFLPPYFFREIVMLLLVAASLAVTHPEVRIWNRFEYHPIVEVAVLFFGIFICMQAPVEILQARGAGLGINSPVSLFWATGILSSFLDNAPTYVVFFETASALSAETAGSVVNLFESRVILEPYLVAVSLGAVLMGANSYIGNGPNFMVKSIAEQSGIKMPSFFGYMLYSIAILIPLFVIIAFFL